jgi:hypothetical protein
VQSNAIATGKGPTVRDGIQLREAQC